MSTREQFQTDARTGEPFTGTATQGFNVGLRHGQTRLDRSDGMTVVTGKCFVTGNEHSVIVPTVRLDRFLAGEHAQVALADCIADDREFLISGTSPDGWEQLFGGDDDDDFDDDDFDDNDSDDEGDESVVNGE